MTLTVIVMAAGKGTRMKSAQPKVLHRLAGRSLLQHVLDMTASLGAEKIITITGHGAAAVEAAARAPNLVFVRQSPQLGTGHAVLQAAPLLPDEGTVLVLNGDVPLVRAETARRLIEACEGRKLALLTVELADPTGYGRVLRGDAAGRDATEGGRVHGIVEHKDATPAQRLVREVYTGLMAAPASALKRWVAALTDDNAQGEYYLTDVVKLAAAERIQVVATRLLDEDEVLGVNSPAQLAELERRLQRAQAAALMEGRRATGRSGARGRARRAAVRAGCRDRHQLHLRGPGEPGRRRAHRPSLRAARCGRRGVVPRSWPTPMSTAKAWG